MGKPTTKTQEVYLKKCAVKECQNVAESRGWCGGHYKRWRKYGDPTATGASMKPAIDAEGRIIRKLVLGNEK